MTQEFHISVTPVGENKYLVRTERVAPGVPLAEEQVEWPIDEWLTQARHLMDDPLLGFLQGHGTNRIGSFDVSIDTLADSESTQLAGLSLVELGQNLYSALFQGTLRDSWVTAQGIAQHRGELLRLRLGLKGLQLPRLPWEVLYGGESADRPRQAARSGLLSRPIATGTDVIFSRYQPGTALLGAGSLTPDADQPLRILMAIATPPDQEWLQLKREAAHLQQELRSQINAQTAAIESSARLPDIQLTILDQPGREELTQALEQGQYQVLHYAGHSNLGAAGGDLYLVNNKTGLTETLSGDDLSGLLVNNGIRMAVFNSCRGAHTATSNPIANSGERNLAETLVSRGIPAVLAMAERIPDDVALSLTRLFYRNLKQGYPVDLSLSRARQGLITSYGSQQLYWALPMLYMHQDFDGYLTAGDRAADNPADRLVLLPPTYDTQPTLTGEDGSPSTASADSVPLESDDELELISKAVLDDDDDDLNGDLNGLVDEFETYNGFETYKGSAESDLESDEELSYEQDAAVVADLIQRLSERQPSSDGIITITNSGIILPPPEDAELQLYEDPSGDSLDALYHNPNWPDTNGASSYSTAASADDTYNDTYIEDTATHVQPASTSTASSVQTRVRNRFALLQLIGIAGSVVIAVLGIQLLPRILSRYDRSPNDLLPSPTAQENSSPTPANPSESYLSRAATPTVTAIATTNFNQNNLAGGQQAVTALLDRGALQEATAALDTVPAEELGNPDINFLRGRLAWEWIKRGNDDFGIDDARRSWETAVKGRPDSPAYLNALGFALYAEGKSRRAIEVWCKSLTLTKTQETSSSPIAETGGISCPVPTQPITDKNAITASAGIALGLKQASENGSLDQPEALMNRAIALYTTVTESDPISFQADELGKTWLWTASAVEDWRALSTR